MAVIKRMHSKATPYKVMAYLTQEEKINPELIHGNNCDPADFASYFTSASYSYHKNLKYEDRKYYHVVHSFSPLDGVTPEQAFELTKQLCEKSDLKGCQYAIITHVDSIKSGGAIHCHVVINNVRVETVDHTYNYEKNHRKITKTVTLKEGNAYWSNNYSLNHMRYLSNELCQEHGFEHSIIPLEQKSQKEEVYTTQEMYMRKRNSEIEKEIKTIDQLEKLDGKADKNRNRKLTEIWKDTLKEQIKQCTYLAGSVEDFISRMDEYFNVEVKISTDKNGNEYFLYRTEDRDRGCNEKRLGNTYGKSNIENSIARNMERLNKEELKRIRFEEYQKNYIAKPHYYVNPKWDKQVTFYGKTKYRRRGRVEEILIRTILRQRVKVLTYEEFKENKYGVHPQQPILSASEYRSALQEMNNSLNVLRIVRENGIHSIRDIQFQKAGLINQLVKGQGNQEQIHLKLSELDKVENNFRVIGKDISSQFEVIAKTSKEVLETVDKIRTFKQSAYAISHSIERINKNISESADKNNSISYRVKALDFAEKELSKMDAELNNISTVINVYKETEDIYNKIGSLMKDGGTKEDIELYKYLLKNNCDLLKEFQIKFVVPNSKPESLDQEIELAGMSIMDDTSKANKLSELCKDNRVEIKAETIHSIDVLCDRVKKFCTSQSEFETILADKGLVLKGNESSTSYILESKDGSITVDMNETGHSMNELSQAFARNKEILENKKQTEIKDNKPDVKEPTQVPVQKLDVKPQSLSKEEYCNSLQDYKLTISVEKEKIDGKIDLSVYDRIKISGMKRSGEDVTRAEKEYKDKYYETIEIRPYSSLKEVPGWKYNVVPPNNNNRYNDSNFYQVTKRDSHNQIVTHDNIKGEVLNLYLDGIIKVSGEHDRSILSNIESDILKSKERMLEPLKDKELGLLSSIQEQKAIVEHLESKVELARVKYAEVQSNKPTLGIQSWYNESRNLQAIYHKHREEFDNAKMKLNVMEYADKKLQTFQMALSTRYRVNENSQRIHERNMQKQIDHSRPSRTYNNELDK